MGREIDDAISGRVYDNQRSWSFWAIAEIAVSIFVVTMISAALAEHTPETCKTRVEAVKRLSTKYLEASKGMGTILNKAVLELFVARSGGWTIFATDAKGCSRLLAAGENWQDVPWNPPLPGKDS